MYFAVNASYSHSFSKPDANGDRFMYLNRVLTGTYTKGNKDMVVPPPRDAKDKSIKFDSAVDDMAKPNMYIVFFDHRAYAEHLIQYS